MKVINLNSYQTTKIKIIKEINESYRTKSTPTNSDIVLPKIGAYGNRLLMSKGLASIRNKPHSIDADNDGNLPVIITIVNSINAGSHSLCVEVKRAQKTIPFG